MNDLPRKDKFSGVALESPPPFFALLLTRLEAIDRRLTVSTQQLSSDLAKIKTFDPSQGPTSLQGEPGDLSTATLMCLERIEYTLGQLECAENHLKSLV